MAILVIVVGGSLKSTRSVLPLRFEKALNRGDFDCPVRPLPPQLTSLQDHLSARGFDQARIDIILPGLREVSWVLK